MSESDVRESPTHLPQRRMDRRSFVRGVAGGAVLLAGSHSLIPSAHAASASVISRGSTSSATVALTFDCGADAGYTSSILNTLSSYGARATFGVTGQFAASNPSLVARMVNEGHDLVNHSYSHASFTGTSSSNTLLSTWARQGDLERTESALVNASGRGGRPLFRPPFGDYNSSVLADIGAIGFTWCVMWSIDVLGWNGLTRDQVINRALSNHGNGYIYLMHVGSQSQEGPALPTIIEGLRSRGYGFVTISQMTGTSPTPPPSSPPPTSGGHAPGTKLRVTTSLNLRTSASTSAGIIATMAAGTIVTVVSGPASGSGISWYQVDTPYGRGWAAAQYMEVSSAPAPTPPPSTPTGHAPGTTLKVTAGLYLRTSASLSSGVITTMPTGTIVTVVSGPSPSGGYTWYQVDSPYGRGWAAGEFLQVTSSTPTQPPPSTPPPTSGGWAAGTTVKVTAGLWLRTAGNLSGSVITTMPVGTVCTVVSGPAPSGGYTWYQLDTPYGRGWAAGEFLTPTTSTPTTPPPTSGGHAPGTRLRVTAGLWLRTAGNLSGSVIATMPTGTIVTVVSGPAPSGGYTWYQVDTPYGRGWAAGEFLVPV